MGVATLRTYAKSDYGVDLTEEEAWRFRARFFAAYPELPQWHRRQVDGPVETRTLAGRRRRGVERFTEKLNSPVQGTAADGFKAGLTRLWESRDRWPSAVPVMAVHDELVVECAAKDGDSVAAWVTECMEAGMQRVVRAVPIAVESSVRASWAG